MPCACYGPGSGLGLAPVTASTAHSDAARGTSVIPTAQRRGLNSRECSWTSSQGCLTLSRRGPLPPQHITSFHGGLRTPEKAAPAVTRMFTSHTKEPSLGGAGGLRSTPSRSSKHGATLSSYFKPTGERKRMRKGGEAACSRTVSICPSK